MSKANKAAAFLANMNIPLNEPQHETTSARPEPKKPSLSAGTRKGLKHIGGYFETETVEKVAVLRARLGLDNSELIKLAIDELHTTQKAKRAFSDL